MKGLILKDLINLKGLLKFQGITILVFALMFILMGNSFFLGMIILMFATMVITTISYDEVDKWDMYALTMPVTRQEMVVSKYLVMIIVNSLGGMFALIVGFIGAVIMRQTFFTEIAAMIGFIYIITYNLGSTMIPLIYKFETEKARLMLMFCALIPTALIFYIAQMDISLPGIDNAWVYVGLLIGLTVVGLIISINASLKIYQKKEF